jgi:hypothetical protein
LLANEPIFENGKKNLVLLEPNNFILKILTFNGPFWQNFTCNEKITIFLLGFFLK